MMLSPKYCEEHTKLIFTILERTPFPEVKCTILIHLADLLERFPNSIEPWSSKMYDRLNDPKFKVRKTAFYVIANLILSDMIRVQTGIATMAKVLVDKEVTLRIMSKDFFISFSHKVNNLYNALPDIFSHLIEDKEISEEDVRSIMKCVKYIGIQFK